MARPGVCVLLSCAALAALAAESPSRRVAAIELVYGGTIDALDALETIGSGVVSHYDGKDRAQWQQVYREQHKRLGVLLSDAPAQGLPPSDARALDIMRRRLKTLPVGRDRPADSLTPSGRCRDAEKKAPAYTPLREALFACFDEIGNRIEFEGARYTRVAALEMLARIEPSSRRRALFLSFLPLWRAVNGGDENDSPYRRLIRIAAADASKPESPVESAAREAGVTSAEVEHWLEEILDAWRQSGSERVMEPWDYRYLAGAADRILASSISRGSMQTIASRYYHDLGADLDRLGVLYDLDPRPGKAPLAYSDVARMGQMIDGAWRPTVPRVSANYDSGGLSPLNELVHENGHAIHYAALRVRPAFMDIDTMFAEAFADVPSWNTYEPAWQRKYLGRAAPETDSLRSLYSSVMLDAAWALFEIRMLRDPTTDPNALWTAITSRYLHIAAHPEWPWWAVRVQLVETPGYMVNYGLGAVLTADIRRHIEKSLGPFDTGDPRWYAWVSERLLRFGLERDTPDLLKEFLGRPASPAALLNAIRRLRAPGT